MTPDANDLCVFAIKRGALNHRFDVRNVMYNRETVSLHKTVSLGELCSEEPCYGTSSTAVERTDEKQPKYIRITDFGEWGIPKNHKYMTTSTYSDKHILQTGDILFARTGGTVGKTYYYDGSIGTAVFAGYCIRFRFDTTRVLPQYVYWYTKTNKYINWVNGIQRPAGQPNINKEEFKSFKIVLPSLQAQKELVTLLEDVYGETKRKLDKANQLLSTNSFYVLEKLCLLYEQPRKKLVYAVSAKELSGRVDADFYSPVFSAFRRQIEESQFEKRFVGDICEKIASGFAAGKQDQADGLPEEQRVPHLRPFSITPEGELSFETQKFVPKDRLSADDYCKQKEVIFNNTNSPEWVGKTTVFDSDVLCAVSNHMTRITVKDGINPYYVAAFFNALLSIGYWKLLCTNFNNQAGVNTETLKKVRIPIPPKSLQDEIASEIMQRRRKANQLRREAWADWKKAKEQFEKELLGE